MSGISGNSAIGSSVALRGLLAVALVFALREAKALLAPVAVAVVLTFVLAPLVRRLRRLGVPEIFGAALVVLALLASTVPLGASLASPAAAWLEKAPTAASQMLAQLDRLRAALPVFGPPAPAPTIGTGVRGQPLPAPAATPDPLKERLASEGVALTGVLASRAAAFMLGTASTVILLYFLLASEHWIVSRGIEATPRRRTRALMLGGARSAQREIGHFLLTQGLINAVVGLLTGLLLWLLGLPNPTLWGVVAAVLSYVPYLGPAATMLLLLGAGVSSFSDTPRMLAPMLCFIVIHALESNVVSPWIVGKRLALSPISVFLSVLFWGWLWGIVGALIAVPMLIALRSLCRRVRSLRLLSRFLEGERRAVPTLRVLLRRAGKVEAAAAP